MSDGCLAPPVPVPVPAATDPVTSVDKKKKKKKKKKSAKNPCDTPTIPDEKPPVLCISRNKHWKYISSYHGPWLQLPIELLDSLLLLNLDPSTLSLDEQPVSTPKSNGINRSFHDFSIPSFPSLPPPFPPPVPGKPTPPPVDPGVFRSVTSIRRLIDEASELSVRASSGLSSAELSAMRNGGGVGGGGASLSGISTSPWAATQNMGLNSLGMPNGNNNGRHVTMSAIRVHRLRALAVSKLAQAYKLDEIASSVMVMQGGSVFDDLAERVLKYDPNDVDAKYVHFFHEKIPSRRSQLAESTNTIVLDEIIAAQPHRLEFYRTRGVVHCFRDEFPQAIKDFTFALKAARRARLAHENTMSPTVIPTKNPKRKKNTPKKRNGQAPPDGTSAAADTSNHSTPSIADDDDPSSSVLLHPSCLPDAPNPIEHQLLFHRGAAYLQQAIVTIEAAALKLEGIDKSSVPEGAELRLCYLEEGIYGGIEIGNPAGPLGPSNGTKFKAYHETFSETTLKEHITSLIKKSIRDHERFIAHFDTLDSPGIIPNVDLAQQVEYSFLLSESLRPGNQHNPPPPPPPPTSSSTTTSSSSSSSSSSPSPPTSSSSTTTTTTPQPPMDIPAMFTTYHPLLVEAHFSVLICQLLLADFARLIPNFIRTASLVDGLEGYPIFLPPRSMSQAEFVEVLERLAGGWEIGVRPHSFFSGALSKMRRKGVRGWKVDEGPVIPPGVVVVGNGKQQQQQQQQKDPYSGMISSPPDSPMPPVPSTSTSTSAYASECGVPSSSSASSSRDTFFLDGANNNNNNYDEDDIHSFPDIEQPPRRVDAEEALDYARILLAPVYGRQKEKRAAAVVKNNGKNGKGAGGIGGGLNGSISIPLHGPRVEIMLAWLGAVHLPELEDGC